MASFAEEIDRLAREVRNEQAREMERVGHLIAGTHDRALGDAANRARALAITKLDEARLWLEESLRHVDVPGGS